MSVSQLQTFIWRTLNAGDLQNLSDLEDWRW